MGDRGGHPPAIVRLVARLLTVMLSTHYVPPITTITSKWRGASDASADPVRAGVGGWITNLDNPDITDVYWYCYDCTPTTHGWILDGERFSDRIAPLELLGTLTLFDELRKKQVSGKLPGYVSRRSRTLI